jgi:hypothetical protein
VNYTGIFGFDISTWQDAPGTPAVVDFRKMRDYGGRFVIVKAGQGTWEDPDFDTNWKNAKGVLPRASYWYLDNRYPPKEQARKYFEIIQHDLEGMCWIDIEDTQAGLYEGWRNWYDFCEELKAVYPGVRIGIYTGFYVWWEYITFATPLQRQYFAQFPLWLASYGADPFHPNYSGILVPLPWLDYLILQSGTPAIGPLVGVESMEVDYNQFSGDEAKFRQYFGGITEPPQEPGEIIMARYEATSIYSMSLRPDHSTANTKIGTIAAGSRMQGDTLWEAPGEKWLYVLSVNGVSLTQPGWIAIVTASRVYCTLTDNQPPTEPAGEYVADFDVTLTAPDGKRYEGTVAGLTLRAVE